METFFRRLLKPIKSFKTFSTKTVIKGQKRNENTPPLKSFQE